MVILLIFISDLGAVSAEEQWDRNDEVRVGLISDIHWRNTSLRELPSLEVLKPKVDDFIDSMNDEFRPDLIIQMGDVACSLSDEGANDTWVNETTYLYRLGSVLGYLEHTGGSEGQGLEAQLFNVIGNHEYRMPEWNRSAIHRALGFESLEETWYSLEISGLSFIMLNTGYTSGEVYNHSIPPAEIAWLGNVLADSTKPTFVFMHIPVTNGTGQTYDSTEGQADLRRLIEDDPDVVAVFYGHCHHVDGWDMILQENVNGTNVSYYHIPAPHELMEDVGVTPWAELTIYLNGTYVLNASYASDIYPTRWEGSFEVDTGPVRISDEDDGLPGFQSNTVLVSVFCIILILQFRRQRL